MAGRSEEEWRSALSEAVDKRVEEAREKAKRGKARAYQTHMPDGRDDLDAYQWEANIIEHIAEQDIERVLERLVVDALRDAGGDDWNSLCDDARTKKIEEQLSRDWERRTTFLAVLDGFERRCLTPGSTEWDTPNVMAVGSVILQELFSANDVEQVVANGSGGKTTNSHRCDLPCA